MGFSQPGHLSEGYGNSTASHSRNFGLCRRCIFCHKKTHREMHLEALEEVLKQFAQGGPCVIDTSFSCLLNLCPTLVTH